MTIPSGPAADLEDLPETGPAGPVSPTERDAIVDALRKSRDETHNVRHRRWLHPPPSRDAIAATVNDFAAALFPAHYGPPALTAETIDAFVGTTLDKALLSLAEQLRRSLAFGSVAEGDEDFDGRAAAIARAVAAALPDIRGILVSDLRAALQGDPAATDTLEIMLVYPGMTAMIHHRLAHALHRHGATFLARLIADIAHSRTGIDIHPGARIGGSFFIDHGTGVVIGETAIIGERVRLYQAVTLGARSFPTDGTGALVKGRPRHPIVEDDVVIYAGATVLGRITIGKGSTIGGNVWLTTSVPPGSRITQAHSVSVETMA